MIMMGLAVWAWLLGAAPTSVTIGAGAIAPGDVSVQRISWAEQRWIVAK
jgi:hypothetical protein